MRQSGSGKAAFGSPWDSEECLPVVPYPSGVLVLLAPSLSLHFRLEGINAFPKGPQCCSSSANKTHCHQVWVVPGTEVLILQHGGR